MPGRARQVQCCDKLTCQKYTGPRVKRLMLLGISSKWGEQILLALLQIPGAPGARLAPSRVRTAPIRSPYADIARSYGAERMKLWLAVSKARLASARYSSVAQRPTLSSVQLADVPLTSSTVPLRSVA